MFRHCTNHRGWHVPEHVPDMFPTCSEIAMLERWGAPSVLNKSPSVSAASFSHDDVFHITVGTNLINPVFGTNLDHFLGAHPRLLCLISTCSVWNIRCYKGFSETWGLRSCCLMHICTCQWEDLKGGGDNTLPSKTGDLVYSSTQSVHCPLAFFHQSEQETWYCLYPVFSQRKRQYQCFYS